MAEPIEISVKQSDKSIKAVLEEDAINEIEDMRLKLGTDSTIEAILYSIKILVAGLQEVDCKKSHKVELPNGKIITFTLKIDEPNLKQHPRTVSEETRKKISKSKKKLYAENPEKYRAISIANLKKAKIYELQRDSIGRFQKKPRRENER
jgi:hypothetical protein